MIYKKFQEDLPFKKIETKSFQEKVCAKLSDSIKPKVHGPLQYTKEGITLTLAIENTTSKPLQICLSPFIHVLSSPMVQAKLVAESGLSQKYRNAGGPEIYPDPNDKYPHIMSDLPPQTAFLITAYVPFSLYEMENPTDLKVNWWLMLNHENVQGEVAAKRP